MFYTLLSCSWFMQLEWMKSVLILWRWNNVYNNVMSMFSYDIGGQVLQNLNGSKLVIDAVFVWNAVGRVQGEFNSWNGCRGRTTRGNTVNGGCRRCSCHWCYHAIDVIGTNGGYCRQICRLINTRQIVWVNTTGQNVIVSFLVCSPVRVGASRQHPGDRLIVHWKTSLFLNFVNNYSIHHRSEIFLYSSYHSLSDRTCWQRQIPNNHSIRCLLQYKRPCILFRLWIQQVSVE